jgi:hypothetical protein
MVEELIKQLSSKGARFHELHVYEDPFEIVLLISCRTKTGGKAFRATGTTFMEALVSAKKQLDSE